MTTSIGPRLGVRLCSLIRTGVYRGSCGTSGMVTWIQITEKLSHLKGAKPSAGAMSRTQAAETRTEARGSVPQHGRTVADGRKSPSDQPGLVAGSWNDPIDCRTVRMAYRRTSRSEN